MCVRRWTHSHLAFRCCGCDFRSSSDAYNLHLCILTFSDDSGSFSIRKVALWEVDYCFHTVTSPCWICGWISAIVSYIIVSSFRACILSIVCMMFEANYFDNAEISFAGNQLQ